MGCSSGKASQPAAWQTGGQSIYSQSTHSSSPTRAGKGGKKEDAFDTSVFILDSPGRIQNFYTLEGKIGEHSLGSVCRVRNKNTGAMRAAKTVLKVHMRRPELLKQEIEVCKQLDHPNIAKLHETFEDHRACYLVTELCEGGELFERIIQAGRLSEAQAAAIMQQVIGAVLHMHERQICHRDLKPDSFLFAGPEPLEKSQLKLVDFGSARRFEDGQVLSTKAGSTYYVAPQVLAGKYDHMCDMWSCGVIMYLTLCGYPPFFGETEGEVLAKVKAGRFAFRPTDWKGVSEDAKTLISGLLKMNPRQRVTAQQALDQDWIRSKAPKAPASLPANFVDNLRGFRSQNRLKKAALHIIAGQLNEEQIRGLREMFQALDRNQDGLLSGREMKAGLLKAGLKDIPADLQQTLDDVDSEDGVGIIDYTEFLAATLDQQLYMQEDVCWSAFRLFDRDGDGKISQDEIKFVLDSGDVNKMIGNAAVEDIINEVDTSGDGKIDFQEFMVMMNTAARREPRLLDHVP